MTCDLSYTVYFFHLVSPAVHQHITGDIHHSNSVLFCLHMASLKGATHRATSTSVMPSAIRSTGAHMCAASQQALCRALHQQLVAVLGLPVAPLRVWMPELRRALRRAPSRSRSWTSCPCRTPGLPGGYSCRHRQEMRLLDPPQAVDKGLELPQVSGLLSIIAEHDARECASMLNFSVL